MKHKGLMGLRWMKTRFMRMPERDNRLTAWLMLILFMYTTGIGVIIALGSPTGAGLWAHTLDIAKAVGINILLFPIATIVIGALLSFMYIPLPRLILAGVIYTSTLSVVTLIVDNSGTWFSYIVGIGLSFIIFTAGYVLIILMKNKAGRMGLLAMLSASVAIIFIPTLLEQKGQQTLQVSGENPGKTMDANPAAEGDYDYRFLTYGSGHARHREAFGDEVDVVTPSVDASDVITSWGEDRQDFWGFGPSNLPVNGRMWLPEGDGPFPVILMVHGNHTMEYFSTDGYDYLGKTLASRGFIAISVDEDFINYSNVSGSPNDNYQLRARMLLEHIGRLQSMNQSQDNVLYHKIDFDQVGLMGHSRGGQAVLMAADYSAYFDDDHLTDTMDGITIQGVVSIAPTDKTIDGHKPSMHNISYLALQGARDGDVNDFRGDRQFYRTTFDRDDDGFKSTLYIADANHTQFNTSWGRRDISLPKGLFLDTSELLEPEEQLQIAKGYVSAFFERVIHKDMLFDQLFRDYRYGESWLPDTTYVNKYRDGAYQSIAAFPHEETGIMAMDGFETETVVTPKDRGGTDRLEDALKLEWEEDATYTVPISRKALTANDGNLLDEFVLTMANIDPADEVPDIGVEIRTTDGSAFELPLEQFMPMPPVITTDYTPFGLGDELFRDGKYTPSWEPVFQTFDIPLKAFQAEDSSFDKADIDQLLLHFKSHPGKILIEDIGVR